MIAPFRSGGFALLSILFCVLAAATARGQESLLTQEEREAGFMPLFNGVDFTGWRFSGQADDAEPAAENWEVAEGVIRLSGGGKPHLITRGEYGDFEMRFEWRAMREKYNSGFFVRSAGGGGKNQINLAGGKEGAFLGGKLEGAKPVPELQRPAGEWNTWRVLAEGENLTFWCNGELAWEGTGFAPAQGTLGLQAEGAPLEFRNLRIRLLAP